MKLCIVANGDFFSDYGGGQVYVRNLVDELIRQKLSLDIDLSIISFASGCPQLPNHKSYKGVDLYELSPLGKVHDLLLSIHPDIVHAHGEKFLIVKACHELSIKCVITAHHGGICCPAGTLLNHKDRICHDQADLHRCLPCYLRNIRTGKFWYPIVKHIPSKLYLKIGAILKRCPFIPILSPIGEAMYSIQEKMDKWDAIRELSTHIIAPSYAIADSMILNGCDKNKITVIPHGIPLPPTTTLTQTDNEIRTPSIIHFYYVGRICYVKGIHVMLKAFAKIDNPDIRLHIIGGTGSRADERYKKTLLNTYKKDSRILWHGKIEHEELNHLVCQFHCLIHPTICLEIYGLNISEAQVQDKFVIATRCGGPEMQIHNEEEGELVNPNDVISLSAAISRYSSNPRTGHGRPVSIPKHVNELVVLYQKTFNRNI